MSISLPRDFPHHFPQSVDLFFPPFALFKEMFSALSALLAPPAFVKVRQFPLVLKERGGQYMSAEELVKSASRGFRSRPESRSYLWL